VAGKPFLSKKYHKLQFRKPMSMLGNAKRNESMAPKAMDWHSGCARIARTAAVLRGGRCLSFNENRSVHE